MKTKPGSALQQRWRIFKKNDFVLTPGRYVGAAEQEEDDEPFAEKMARLTAQLKTQMEESAKLEAKIKANLGGLGYEF